MEIAGRDFLHQLVDSLPEDALEAVERALQRFQTWPPAFPEAQKLKERMDELLAARRARDGQGGQAGAGSRIGYVSRSTGGAYLSAREGHGRAQARGMIDGAESKIDLYQIHGQVVQTERQITVSPDKRKLLYKVTIKGPDGKEARREMEFDITEAPPAPL